MVHLSFFLSITATSLLRFFAGKTEGAECTSCWTPFVDARAKVMKADDASTANKRVEVPVCCLVRLASRTKLLHYLLLEESAVFSL